MPLPHDAAHTPSSQNELVQSAWVAQPIPTPQPVKVRTFGNVQFALQRPQEAVFPSSQISLPSTQPLPQEAVQTRVGPRPSVTQVPLAQSALLRHSVPPAQPGYVSVAVQLALQVPHASVFPSSQVSPGWVVASPQ
jgi:hypothetical protein